MKIERRALGTILGSSWRVLGPFWVAFPPPWGAPGRLQEVIFGRFWDVPAEILKMSFCLSFFHIFGVFFLFYYLPSVVFLAPWLAASCICKKLKFHWFLWVASHMRLVLATPEAINFQGGRVINIGGKKSSKKGPTGPENKVNNRAFLVPKWLPTWLPTFRSEKKNVTSIKILQNLENKIGRLAAPAGALGGWRCRPLGPLPRGA